MSLSVRRQPAGARGLRSDNRAAPCRILSHPGGDARQLVLVPGTNPTRANRLPCARAPEGPEVSGRTAVPPRVQSISRPRSVPRSWPVPAPQDANRNVVHGRAARRQPNRDLPFVLVMVARDVRAERDLWVLGGDQNYRSASREVDAARDRATRRLAPRRTFLPCDIFVPELTRAGKTIAGSRRPMSSNRSAAPSG